MSAQERQSLTMTFQPVAGAAVMAIAEVRHAEMAVVSPRGEGKTSLALAGMVLHAQIHEDTCRWCHARRAGHSRDESGRLRCVVGDAEFSGYRLPTKWLGVADTFRSHEMKTHASLMDPMWAGCWRIRHAGQIAEFRLDGQLLVELLLTGVEDQAGVDRVRTQCHGVWFEEPAPALVQVQSSGLGEQAWAIALSSMRLPTFAHPAVMTLNPPPDEEHWTWQRFHGRPCAHGCELESRVKYLPWLGVSREVEFGCKHRRMYRIPQGERVSAEQIAANSAAFAGDAGLHRRLVEGEPGGLLLGEQVAHGFQKDLHAPHGLKVVADPTATLWMGQDGGLTPTTVFGQRQGHRVVILGAVSSEHDGVRQHVRELVRPWLAEFAPWALDRKQQCRVVYDPAMDKDGEGDTESNALAIMRRELPAIYVPGPVRWLPRIQPLLNQLVPHDGLRIDRERAKGLVKALEGGWHYATGLDGKVKRDEPVKNHPHSDYGDALAYLIAGMAPARPPRETSRGRTEVAFDPFRFDKRPVQRAASRRDFSVFGR